MGKSKSPAKWIKSVLFGKKSSKSDALKKAGNEKESIIVAKVPSSDGNPTSLSNPEPSVIDRNDRNPEIERGKSDSFSNEPSAVLPIEQVIESKGTGALDNAEIVRQEQAASVVQAAFRGYLARRAFWALKGIIRLQALIRGHLVRRQAIATLRCMQGIVKLQAMVRGQLVRHSEAGLHVQKKSSLQKSLDTKLDDPNGVTKSIQLETLSEYAFVRKLFASSPSAMPLSLQYDPAEPNSSWSWLDRWSLSFFWEPLVLMQSSIVHDFQSQKKLGNSQNVDTETITRPRRSVRRVSTTNTESSLLASTAENGKHKNNLKKAVVHQPEAQIENPQNELERVKRSLRKISSSMTEANGRSEPVMEKPNHNFINLSSSPVPDVIELPLDNFSEKISNAKLEDSETQESPKLLEHKPLDEPQALENNEKDQNISLVIEEFLPKENETSKERRKNSRRKSFSAKQDSPENGSQNTPTLPSYMAATVSAKAKLRGQESPRFSQDVADNVIIRRHSLSYSTPGKSNSQSPKMQKMTQTNGKGGAKGDRSLLPSRDNNERVTHGDWKR